MSEVRMPDLPDGYRWKFFAPKPDRRIDVNTLTNVTIGKGIKHSNE